MNCGERQTHTRFQLADSASWIIHESLKLNKASQAFLNLLTPTRTITNPSKMAGSVARNSRKARSRAFTNLELPNVSEEPCGRNTSSKRS